MEMLITLYVFGASVLFKIGHIIVMYREFKLNIYMKLLFKIWLLMAINYVLLLSSIHIDL